jgi:16S rRNA (cytidine1402-2'-O)-methyltransferase
VVLVIAGAAPPEPAAMEQEARARAAAMRREGVAARDVARAIAEEFGVARNLAYRLAHEEES